MPMYYSVCLLQKKILQNAESWPSSSLIYCHHAVQLKLWIRAYVSAIVGLLALVECWLLTDSFDSCWIISGSDLRVPLSYGTQDLAYNERHSMRHSWSSLLKIWSISWKFRLSGHGYLPGKGMLLTVFVSVNPELEHRWRSRRWITPSGLWSCRAIFRLSAKCWTDQGLQ